MGGPVLARRAAAVSRARFGVPVDPEGADDDGEVLGKVRGVVVGEPGWRRGGGDR